MIVPVPQITAPAYQGMSANDVDRCFNFYNAKTPDGPVLVSRPGLTLFTTATNNLPCKGMYMAGVSRLFSVHGTKLYETDSNGTVTDRGTLSGLGDFVDMADNGLQLMVRGDTAGWVFTFATNALAQIADANYPASTTGLAFRDSVFIVSDVNGRIYVSQLLDGTDWTPVSFATAESKSDPLGGLASVGANLYLIGSRTTETWYNTGNSAFTFQPINGAQIDAGTYYSWSIATLFDSVYFVSESQGKQAVWRIGGGGAVKISTPYIEERIRGYNPVRGVAFSDNGNDFYVLSAYTSPFKSWAYNITLGTWSEWGSSISSSAKQWRVNAIAPGFPGTSKVLAGDFENGKIYSLAGNNEDGIDIDRERIYGPIGSNSKRVFHSQIRFEYEVKFDATGTTTVAPLLSWSDDGGLTYGTSRTMTKTVTSTASGQRVTCSENRLGASAERYYKLRFPTTLTGRIILKKCELDLREGRF